MKKIACSFSDESLKVHSAKSVEYGVDKFFSFQPSYVKVCVERLNFVYKFNPSLTPELFKELCKIACYLHDSGKAANIYQVQFMEGCKCKKDLSFAYHEVLSALVVHRYFEKAHFSEKLKTLTTFAVLNHMHAVRPYTNKDKVIGELKRRCISFDKRLGDPFAFNLIDIDEYIKNSPIPMSGLYECFEKAITLMEISEFLGKMERVVTYENKLYTYILTPIVVGDNLAASERQEGGARQVFKRELMELIQK